MICIFVVIVDDEPDHCGVITLLIERIEGIERVIGYTDPFTGLAGVLKDQPDVVLIDGSIEEMGAGKFADTVRFYAKDMAWRPLFMVMSVSTDIPAEDFYHCFTKPIKRTELVSIFRRVVNLQKSHTEELREYIISQGATTKEADTIAFVVRTYAVKLMALQIVNMNDVYTHCAEIKGMSAEYLPKLIKRVLGKKFASTPAKIVHDLAYDRVWKEWKGGKKTGEGAR